MASVGPVEERPLFKQLANQATYHALSGEICNVQSSYLVRQPSTFVRYGKGQFFGLLIDGGAAHASSAGWDQYLALSREQDVQIDRSQAGRQSFIFGMGMTLSKGTVTVASPIGNVVFHVVDADTPFLLCLDDLDRLGYYLNNITNELVGKDRKVPVVRLNGHAFLTWGNSSINYVAACFLNSISDAFPSVILPSSSYVNCIEDSDIHLHRD